MKLSGNLLASLLCALVAAPAARATADFETCRAALAERAIAEGMSRDVIMATVPLLQEQERVVALDQRQPEFVQTFPDYVAKRVTPERVRRGRELLARHQAFLDELQARFGVPGRYLVAFWGLETNYGSFLGKMPTLDSLATLACDPRRSDFFTREFLDALRLMQRESLRPEQMVGSWAGAVGHTQFMPSSYLRHAIDGDGDGRIDLWGSERDALASGASLLSAQGWTPGQRWGRQVSLPAGFDYRVAGSGHSAPLADWAAMGVLRPDGGRLPVSDMDASLLLPAGHQGPAFLVYDNFAVVMRWNLSQSYALSVGLLADRLAGAPAASYGEGTVAPLAFGELMQAQQALLEAGYDAGAPDGILGSRTRAALREFQLSEGLPADGYPDRATLDRLMDASPQ